MGNATFYVGAGCMVWNGKQLTYLELSNNDRMAFSYDENGLRTEKCIENLQTNYYYNGSVLIGMTTGEMGASTIIQRFSYDSSGNVVSVGYSSNGGNTFATYYYLRNGQNDVVKLIDSSGTSVVQYTYDTWGAQTSCTGTLATTLGQNQPFRYRGYVYDTETGWYYLQSRYYNPATCRFISADVLLSTGQGVLGHNAYAYCLNNPVNMSDPSGYGSFWDKLKSALAVVAVVAVVVAVVAVAVVAAVPTGGGSLALAGGGIIAAASAASAATTVVVAGTAVAVTATVGIGAIEAGQSIAHSTPRYPGNNPNESPGDDWEWRGKGNQGDGKGNYTNPKTGESLHPDLGHPKPVGPHWDYKDILGKWWRLFSDGRVLPK